MPLNIIFITKILWCISETKVDGKKSSIKNKYQKRVYSNVILVFV